MTQQPGDVTQLLIAYRDGDAEAFHALVAIVYDDLRRMARIQLRRERIRDTLDTTALVHEAYLKLADITRLSVRDRGHFFAISAVAMRRIVIDHARERMAQKRGGGQVHVPVDESSIAADAEADHLISIDDALGRLEQAEPVLARVIDCRFFAGYTEQETAAALGMSLRSVQRAWARARAWLALELGDGAPTTAST